MRASYEKLREIGYLLDRDIFPVVMNGGIVMPGETVEQNIWAKEKEYEQQGSGRPQAGPGTGTAGWQRPADRRWEACATPSAVSRSLQRQYEAELTAVQKAYPGTRVWRQQEGLWLRTESSLLPGLWQKAVFLTGIPFSSEYIVRGWGFWMGAPQSHPVWIGPKHTNFPDGSICAFETSDETWHLGDSLVLLLDLYTLWALRQLHQQVFKHWPGRQVAHYVHERLTELKEDEYCGCGSDVLYRDCCRPKDLRSDRVLAAVEYYGFGVRNPPVAVQDFIRTFQQPPVLNEVLPRS